MTFKINNIEHPNILKRMGFSALLNAKYSIKENMAIGVRYSLPVAGYRFSDVLDSGNLKNSVLGFYLVTGLGQ